MFNLLYIYQNLSSCSSGSFFPRLPLFAATFFSPILTHNKVIIAPITAPTAKLPKNLPDGNILSHAVKKMSLGKERGDLCQWVIIAVIISAAGHGSVKRSGTLTQWTTINNSTNLIHKRPQTFTDRNCYSTHSMTSSDSELLSTWIATPPSMMSFRSDLLSTQHGGKKTHKRCHVSEGFSF